MQSLLITDNTEETQPVDALFCFKELLIPKFATYRMGSIPLPVEFRDINPKMRHFLTRNFQNPAHDILFYLHEDSAQGKKYGIADTDVPRRVWLNGKEIQKKLEKEENMENIKVVPGFYGLFCSTG